jgi:hypothetical protein
MVQKRWRCIPLKYIYYTEKPQINAISIDFFAHIHPNQAETALLQIDFILSLPPVTWNTLINNSLFFQKKSNRINILFRSIIGKGGECNRFL